MLQVGTSAAPKMDWEQIAGLTAAPVHKQQPLKKQHRKNTLQVRDHAGPAHMQWMDICGLTAAGFDY